MGITNASNFGSGQTMKWTSVDTDPIDRATQVSATAENLDEHDHSNGLGLPVARLSATCEINDSAGDHQYVFSAANLAADRTVSWPLLTGNDTFVFEAHTQTLTNKTLTSPTITSPTITGTVALTGAVLTTPEINDSASDHQYIFASANLSADRTVSLPLLTGNDTFVFEAHTQTLTNKTITSPSIGGTVAGSATYTTPTLTTPTINGVKFARTTKVFADSPVTLAATNTIVYCDCTNGAITINLPTAVGNDGLTYWIKKIDSTGNAVTVDPNGAETVEDAATLTIGAFGDSYTISSDNAEWWVI